MFALKSPRLFDCDVVADEPAHYSGNRCRRVHHQDICQHAARDLEVFWLDAAATATTAVAAAATAAAAAAACGASVVGGSGAAAAATALGATGGDGVSGVRHSESKGRGGGSQRSGAFAESVRKCAARADLLPKSCKLVAHRPELVVHHSRVLAHPHHSRLHLKHLLRLLLHGAGHGGHNAL